jgi:hypothetical protein
MKSSTFGRALGAIISLATLLSGCGGGDTEAGQPLPISDDAPAAYTVAYLNAHPNLLVQPEHMIIARLDPSTPAGAVQSVRLHIREQMTLGLGAGGSQAIS